MLWLAEPPIRNDHSQPDICILAPMSRASTASQHDLASYRREFPIFDQQRYLSTCSLGALSIRSKQRISEFLSTWDARGAAAWYDTWWEALAELRRRYAGVIGAHAREIALHASVSTATGVLASALDYAARPKVVTTELDFPTVAYQWLAKRPLGIEIEVVESPDGITVPVERIAAAVDDRTALVATSHVYFRTGAIQRIGEIAEAAHRHGALCFVDAYQSAGQVPLNVHSSGVDFLVAGGLKWLLGGPGIVFLYAREELIPSLRPTVTGWFAHAEQFAFDSRDLVWQSDARRLEQGTPSLAAVYSQLGGLDVIEEIGIERISRVVRVLTEDLVARATEAGLTPSVAPDPEARSAIVMIPHPDPNAAVQALSNVSIVSDARPGHVRLSPFFYNIVDDHARAIEALIE